MTNDQQLKQGDRLFNDTIVTQAFADSYNALTAKIDTYLKAPEELLNGRHNLFMAFISN